MWLIKKDKSRFIDQNGKNALNHFILLFIVGILNVPLVFFGIGIITGVMLGIFSLVVLIIAAIKAKNGIVWTIPGFNFIKID